jgi:hypothetical protein
MLTLDSQAPIGLLDFIDFQIWSSCRQERRLVHNKDLAEGFGFPSVPITLKRKYGDSLTDFGWQYLIPSTTRCCHPYDGYICRHHLHRTAYTKQLRRAVKAGGVKKRVTAHTNRLSFATNLLTHGTDIRTVQELLGHNDIRTTEIYTHVIGQRRAGTVSPIDTLMGASRWPQWVHSGLHATSNIVDFLSALEG